MQEIQETRVQSQGQEDPLEEEVSTTPVLLPGKFHGERNMAGSSPQGCEELDTTEWLSKLFYNEYALWLMLSLRNIDIQKFLISHRCLDKLRWPFPKPWQLVAEIGYTLWEEHTVSFVALIRQPGNPTPKRTLQRQLNWERVSAQHATRQT